MKIVYYIKKTKRDHHNLLLILNYVITIQNYSVQGKSKSLNKNLKKSA